VNSTTKRKKEKVISTNENSELYFLNKMIETQYSAIHTTNLITLHNASDEEATNNGCPSPKRTFHIQWVIAIYIYRCSMN